MEHSSLFCQEDFDDEKRFIALTPVVNFINILRT